MIKLLISILLLSGSLALAKAQDNPITTIILFRHAEAVQDDSKNPALNEIGKERAVELSRVLSKTEIQAVYSTELKRTILTASAIASERGLEIIYYDPFSKTFIDEVLEKHQGETIAISGHSNTTPSLVNQLIGEEKYPALDHNVYDNIFFVSYIGKENVKVIQTKYGQKSQ